MRTCFSVQHWSLCGVFAATALLSPHGRKTCFAAEDEASPSRFHAMVIHAAGRLPGSDKPEGADAITHATTKELNTYVLVSKLTEKLKAAGVEARVVDYTECSDLSCLYSQEKDGEPWKVDLVVFAGPAYYSKQPEQLLKLLPKLDEAVRRVPDIVCSSLVPAWYPETKGVAAAKHSDRYFEKAGAGRVMGISALTPRDKKPGIGEKELDDVLSKFAADLLKALSQRK